MTALLNPRVWLALAIAGVLAWTHLLAFDQGGAKARTELSAYVADAERRRADAERLQRSVEAQRERDITEIANNAQTQINALAADLAAARSAADGLRIAAASAASAARKNTCPASAGQTAPDTLGMFVELLSRVEERGRAMAEYADRSRIAGDACVRAYGALTSK